MNKTDRYNQDTFSQIVSNSKSLSEIVTKLGLKTTYGNRETTQRYINKFNLSTTHFDNGVSKNKQQNKSKKRSLEELFTLCDFYVHNTDFKNRLYKEVYKKRECELCGQGEMWKGKKMSLILDHINGIHNDNRLENLQIVCPNCNATLETHGGKNIKC